MKGFVRKTKGFIRKQTFIRKNNGFAKTMMRSIRKIIEFIRK